MNEFTLREAKSFRPQIDMKKADKRPGYYKWWCPYDLMPTVLGKLDFKLEDAPLEIKEINGNKYYCIYIGIAVNEPLMKRLDWHINETHTKSKIEHRTLSTLRQSVAAICCGNMKNEAAVNAFIDQLYVEYKFVDAEIKSDKAKQDIKDNWETKNLVAGAEYFYPLNIQDNKHTLATTKSCKKLKELKKAARETALKHFN